MKDLLLYFKVLTVYIEMCKSSLIYNYRHKILRHAILRTFFVSKKDFLSEPCSYYAFLSSKKHSLCCLGYSWYHPTKKWLLFSNVEEKILNSVISKCEILLTTTLQIIQVSLLRLIFTSSIVNWLGIYIIASCNIIKAHKRNF